MQIDVIINKKTFNIIKKCIELHGALNPYD